MSILKGSTNFILVLRIVSLILAVLNKGKSVDFYIFGLYIWGVRYLERSKALAVVKRVSKKLLCGRVVGTSRGIRTRSPLTTAPNQRSLFAAQPLVYQHQQCYSVC